MAAQWAAGRPSAAFLDWIPGRVWQAIDAASAAGLASAKDALENA